MCIRDRSAYASARLARPPRKDLTSLPTKATPDVYKRQHFIEGEFVPVFIPANDCGCQRSALDQAGR